MVNDYKKQLTNGILMSLAALVVLIFATLAWFANNDKTDADSMAVQSDASPNLVIADTAQRIESISDDSEDGFRVTLSLPKVVLSPATNNWEKGSITGLLYNTTPRRVSYNTGNKVEEDLILAPVPEYKAGDKKRYYLDAMVYIASRDKKMLNSDLTVSISKSTEDDLPDYTTATSVDFYVENISAANYKGTLNLAGKDHTNSEDDLTEILLFEDTTIPYNKTGCVCVWMRFYFDGALQKSDNQAYIYSADLSSTNIAMNISFKAEEH